MKKIILLILILNLFSCANSLDRQHGMTALKSGKVSDVSMGPSHVKKLLKSQYKKWKGTRYRIGGLSRRGIDCSGFVYLTFLNKFNIKLPREVRGQVKCGVNVLKKSINVGDLVFFKTGFRRLHVGIYWGQNRFLHVSTKKGVMISSMDNSYWKRKYWKARHLNI